MHVVTWIMILYAIVLMFAEGAGWLFKKTGMGVLWLKQHRLIFIGLLLLMITGAGYFSFFKWML